MCSEQPEVYTHVIEFLSRHGVVAVVEIRRRPIKAAVGDADLDHRPRCLGGLFHPLNRVFRRVAGGANARKQSGVKAIGDQWVGTTLAEQQMVVADRVTEHRPQGIAFFLDVVVIAGQNDDK